MFLFLGQNLPYFLFSWSRTCFLFFPWILFFSWSKACFLSFFLKIYINKQRLKVRNNLLKTQNRITIAILVWYDIKFISLQSILKQLPNNYHLYFIILIITCDATYSLFDISVQKREREGDSTCWFHHAILDHTAASPRT